MQSLRLFAGCLAGIALALACTSTSTVSQCVPGASTACVCPGGAAGSQRCLPDGTYGACACALSDAGVDLDATHDGAPNALDAGHLDAPVSPSDLPDVAASDAPDTGASCGDAGRCGEQCVTLTSDPHHCGRCGHDCAQLSGVIGEQVRCEDGVCRVEGACQPGRAHCSSREDDGCETLLDSNSHCGGCGVACRGSTPYCGASVDGGASSCVSGCGDAVRCGMSCVDTGSNAAHCGACERRCPAPAHGVATCTGGVCGAVCERGFHRCDNRCAPDEDLASCGDRCAPCPEGANATAACVAGACALRCASGFADCDGDPANGCEVDTRASSRHCGACGNACAAPGDASAACVEGVCGFVCDPGFTRAGDGCVAPRGSCPVAQGAAMTTVLHEEFDGSTLNPTLFRSQGTTSVAGGSLTISHTAPSSVTTLQFSAPAVVEVRGVLPQTSVSYNHFALNRCGGYAAPCPIDFWSISSHWENRTAQVQLEWYTPTFQREHFDTAYDARQVHTYRFELGEHAQRSYVDGVLVREYSHEVPQGTAWSFSAGTWQSTTPAQIDSITVQAQATCGFCAP